MEAFQKGMGLYRESMRDAEKPTALLTSVYANSQRDPRKQKKSYTFEDFCFYMTREDKRLPDGHYGAAALALQEEKRFPSWALFCFTQLISGASKTYKPKINGLVSANAVLLDPVFKGDSVTGFLIVKEQGSLQTECMEDGKGMQYEVLMPEVPTKVVAQEDITLLLRKPLEAKVS